MRIKVSGERAEFFGNITPKLLSVIPLLEGRKVWAKDRSSFRFDASAYNLGLLQNSVGAEIEQQPDMDMAEAFAPAPPVGGVTGWTSKTEAMPHQIEAEKFIDGKSCVALFMETGTGKTKVIIDWSKQLFSRGLITGHLVISKKGAHRQWTDEEYPKHFDGEGVFQSWPFRHIDPRMLTPGNGGNGLAVMSFNWDGVKTKKGFEAALEFVQAHQGKLLITCDESQEMKNRNSQRHKTLAKLRPYSSHRAIATGTPIAVDLTDEWAQLNWLDPKILGMKYVTTFRANFCRMGGFQNKQVVGHHNIDLFRRLTAPHVFRVTKEEIGIAPPMYSTWRFDLTSDQKRMIREIRQDLETEFDGNVLTIEHALTMFNKMSQIASGIVIDRENNQTHRLMPLDKNPRIVTMMEWIDAAGDNRTLIWHRFKEEAKMLREAFDSAGLRYFDYASMKPDEFDEAKKEFRSPGGQLILFGNPQSGLGTGQNLQGACNQALYVSHADRLVDRLQSQDRILRIGTKGVVTFSNLVARASPDIRTITNNQRKLGISDMALSGLRDLLREMASEDR